MANNSTEQKLFKIFSQAFQVKRLMKQISDLKQLREKGSFDIKMSVLRNQCLIFKVEMLPPAYKSVKLPDNLAKTQQEFKIIIRKSYPAHPPRLFFMNENMTKYGFKPFRDYINELLQSIEQGQWSAKITIQQLIKSMASFFQKLQTNKEMLKKIKYPIFQQLFQIDSIYSWKFCQLYPVRLQKKSIIKSGFIYIDVFASEIIILDDVGIESSYSLTDYIRGFQVLTLRKKKNSSSNLLLEVKLNYNGLSGKYCIEFSCQDYEPLLIGIMDCAKIMQNGKKVSQTENKNVDSSSQDETDQDQQDQQKLIQKKTSNMSQNPSINQLVEQILIYESLVDNKMTSKNLSQLVSLLQKAIQYYSAQSDQRFTIYLNKMQNILSNQMAQALLQSTHQAKKNKNSEKVKNNQQEYQSVIDLL